MSGQLTSDRKDWRRGESNPCPKPTGRDVLRCVALEGLPRSPRELGDIRVRRRLGGDSRPLGSAPRSPLGTIQVDYAQTVPLAAVVRTAGSVLWDSEQWFFRPQPARRRSRCCWLLWFCTVF